MDSPADWTASALFSPSKARAQQAQAKDWAYVEAWLVKRYSKGLPSFERNEETLQALLSLATVNENADDHQALVERVEKTATQAGSRRLSENDDIFNAIFGSLNADGHESLTTLAESSVLLGSVDSSKMALAMCDISSEQLDLTEQLRVLGFQEGALEREHARLEGLLKDLASNDFKAPPDLPEQTAEWMRNAKPLKAKLAEYDERLSALRATNSISTSIESVTQRKRELQLQRQRLADLNVDLSAFDSLPSDSKAARTKMESARAELRDLTKERDQLFEGLATH